MNLELESYFSESKPWANELMLLRELVLACELLETCKWKQPCYVFKQKNILILSRFKDYCAINFFKGAYLKDELKVLTEITAHVKAARQWRFTNTKDIVSQKEKIKSYIIEAIEVEQSGVKMEFEETIKPPTELLALLKDDATFNKAFNGLSPGKQRGYFHYFSGAKQASSRITRIERYYQKILNGKGFYDCDCGLSKKMPTCDGSHRQLQGLG